MSPEMMTQATLDILGCTVSHGQEDVRLGRTAQLYLNTNESRQWAPVDGYILTTVEKSVCKAEKLNEVTTKWGEMG